MALCQFLENNQRQVDLLDKAVLEIGAGTGLLSIVASLLGTPWILHLTFIIRRRTAAKWYQYTDLATAPDKTAAHIWGNVGIDKRAPFYLVYMEQSSRRNAREMPLNQCYEYFTVFNYRLFWSSIPAWCWNSRESLKTLELIIWQQHHPPTLCFSENRTITVKNQ